MLMLNWILFQRSACGTNESIEKVCLPSTCSTNMLCIGILFDSENMKIYVGTMIFSNEFSNPDHLFSVDACIVGCGR